MQNKGSACGRAFIIAAVSYRNAQTSVILCCTKSYQGLYPSPLSVPHGSHHNFCKIKLWHNEGRALHMGERSGCECCFSNRLNELVIHTPTDACGCQNEKKEICHYGEVKRSLHLSFSKCSCCLVCLAFFFFSSTSSTTSPRTSFPFDLFASARLV